MKGFDADDAADLARQVQLLEHAMLGYAQVLKHSNYSDPIGAMQPILGHAEHVRRRLEEVVEAS